MQPLRQDVGGPGELEDGGAADAASWGAEEGPDAAADGQGAAAQRAEASAEPARTPWAQWMKGIVVDALLCFPFAGIVMVLSTSGPVLPGVAGALLLLAMVIWRVAHARLRPDEGGPTLPYTCGSARADGQQLFLVATLHISPRAPRDVLAVLEAVAPDLVMIELDDERLNEMRETDALPRRIDLQPIELTVAGQEPISVLAQRAFWNAEHAGEDIAGPARFDAANPFGLGDVGPGALGGGLAVVRRGAAPGQLACFAMKAHMAARAGASAVLVINSRPEFPAAPRIGTASLWTDLRVAWRTRRCGFPPIPLLLLPPEHGESLMSECRREGGSANVSFRVLADDFPRRSLRRRLCQAFAFAMSGVGILYSIIDWCAVDAGEEFVAAEAAAGRRRVPCACIDVDVDRLCSRVCSSVLPTPRNLVSAALAWVAFPRVFLRTLFPARGSVDVLGGAALHVLSFRLRTWAAILLAGACAGCFLGLVLALFGVGLAGAAEGAGVVGKDDANALPGYVMLAIELYVFPRLYEAVAASRDEAMYQGIVARAAQHRARRLVAVVGAAHANGILERVACRGLVPRRQ